MIGRDVVRNEHRERLTIRGSQRERWRMVRCRKGIEKYFRILRHGYVVPAAIRCNSAWSRSCIAESDRVEMPLQGRFGVRHEVQDIVALVEPADGASLAVSDDFPLALGEL